MWTAQRAFERRVKQRGSAIESGAPVELGRAPEWLGKIHGTCLGLNVTAQGARQCCCDLLGAMLQIVWASGRQGKASDSEIFGPSLGEHQEKRQRGRCYAKHMRIL